MILLLSETHLTEKIKNQEINIKNYNIIRSDSNSRHTGGTAIYIRKTIQYKVISNENKNKNMWITSIEIIKHRNLNGQYTVLYHSPSSSDADFIKFFEEWIEKNNTEEKQHVICGDFNIDISNNTNKKYYKDKLQKTINENGMKQKINEYTRVTKNTKTLIDLLITNAEEIEGKTINEDNISDHTTINIIKYKYKNEIENKEKTITILKYEKEELQNELKNTDWSFCENKNLSCSEKAEYIVKKLKESIEKFKKDIILKDTKNENKWYDKKLLKMKKSKIETYKIAKQTNDSDTWIKYKTIRNRYSKMIKMASNNYTKQSIKECKGDSKAMWRKIKELTKEKQSEVHSIEIKGIEISDKNQVAEKLNDYFIESIQELNKNIKPMPDPIIKKNNERTQIEKFKFEQIKYEDIERIIKNIKTKSDIDMINKNVIINSMPIIGDKIVKIINESFSKGEFPETWKQSQIKPIYKVKNSKNMKDIRPINMLPTYEKIIEKLADEQLQRHIDKNKIITENQSGYRKGHSCETSINMVIQKWKEAIDEDKTIICVFLDFSRAFETIDREILIEKLHEIGIENNELNWYKTYLANRTQTTKVGNQISKIKSNNFGVPQGSVSGAKLFNLYINNIETVIEHSQINMFADDTMIYIISKDLKQAQTKLNIDLKNIERWLSKMKLKINTEKTKYVIINNRQKEKIKISMQDMEIEQVKTTKYLGIIIDEKLDFKENFDYVCKKMAKKVGFMGRISKKLDLETKITIYKTIIAPHLDYCSSILYLANENQITKLQKIQNKAMRIILKLNKYTNIKLMLDMLKWQSVRQRLTYNTLITIHKIDNDILPQYLKKNLIKVGQNSNYNTRNKNELRLPKYKKAKTQNNIFYNGIKKYNEISKEIKNEKRMNIFKKKLSKWILDNIEM